MSHTRFNPITRESSPEKIKGIKIPTPASGKVELLSDPILSALGEGVEISVSSHQVVSPINGLVLDTQPSHGKVILQAKNKLKFLLQLPTSYIEQLGIGIGCQVKVGDRINIGDTLLTLDLYKIQQHLKPIILQFVLLDSSPFGRIQVPHKSVEVNQDIIFSLVPLPKK